jgi:hypothetical protein
MSQLPTEATFLKDVANHEMTVKHDDGFYRHLRFNKPGTRCHGFDITTWPGMLCYSGDMGRYVFRRTSDMLEFFRWGNEKDEPKLHINPSYWGEKAEAIDRNGSIREYSSEKFKKQIQEWMDEGEFTQMARRSVGAEVLSRADDGEREAMQAVLNFEHDGYSFQDFHEINVSEYSYRFLWCCYALAWAVKQYDAAKAGSEVSP